jgi:hypothetical protein
VNAAPPQALPSPNRVAGGLVAVGAAIAAIGGLLPSITASALILSGISRPYGQIIAVVATESALLGVLMMSRRVMLIVPVALLLLAVGAMRVLVVDYQVLNEFSPTRGVLAQMVPGIYATGLGVVIWAIGALASIWERR